MTDIFPEVTQADFPEELLTIGGEMTKAEEEMKKRAEEKQMKTKKMQEQSNIQITNDKSDANTHHTVDLDESRHKAAIKVQSNFRGIKLKRLFQLKRQAIKWISSAKIGSVKDEGSRLHSKYKWAQLRAHVRLVGTHSSRQSHYRQMMSSELERIKKLPKVMLSVQKDEEVPMWLQGNLDFYQQDMLVARNNLRTNKMVMQEIDRWWHVFADDKEGKWSKSQYIKMLVHMSKALLPKFNKRRVAKQADKDFKKDSKHAKHIDYQDFTKGLFELADVWVDAIDASVYVDFLRKAFPIVFKDGERGMRGITNVKHADMMSALELPPSATTYPVELPELADNPHKSKMIPPIPARPTEFDVDLGMDRNGSGGGSGDSEEMDFVHEKVPEYWLDHLRIINDDPGGPEYWGVRMHRIEQQRRADNAWNSLSPSANRFSKVMQQREGLAAGENLPSPEHSSSEVVDNYKIKLSQLQDASASTIQKMMRAKFFTDTKEQLAEHARQKPVRLPIKSPVSSRSNVYARDQDGQNYRVAVTSSQTKQSGSEAYRNILHERGLRRSPFDEPTSHLGYEFDVGGVTFNMYSGHKPQSNTIARPDFLNERERSSPGSDSPGTDQEMYDADESADSQQRWRRQRRRRKQRKKSRKAKSKLEHRHGFLIEDLRSPSPPTHRAKTFTKPNPHFFCVVESNANVRNRQSAREVRKGAQRQLKRKKRNGASAPKASEHLDVALHDLSQTRRKNRLKKLKAEKTRLAAIENKNFRPYRGSALFKQVHTMSSVKIDIDTLDDRLPKRVRGKSRKNFSVAKTRVRGRSEPTVIVNVGSRNKVNGLSRGSGTQLFRHAISFDSLQEDDYDDGADDGPDFGPWSGVKPPRTFPSASPRLNHQAFPAVHSKPSGEYKNDTMDGGFVNGSRDPTTEQPMTAPPNEDDQEVDLSDILGEWYHEELGVLDMKSDPAAEVTVYGAASDLFPAKCDFLSANQMTVTFKNGYSMRGKYQPAALVGIDAMRHFESPGEARHDETSEVASIAFDDGSVWERNNIFTGYWCNHDSHQTRAHCIDIKYDSTSKTIVIGEEMAQKQSEHNNGDKVMCLFPAEGQLQQDNTVVVRLQNGIEIHGMWTDGSIRWAPGHFWIKTSAQPDPMFMDSSDLMPLFRARGKRQPSPENRRESLSPPQLSTSRVKNFTFPFPRFSGTTSPRVGHPRMNARSSANLLWQQKKISSRAMQRTQGTKLSQLEKSKVARDILRSAPYEFEYEFLI